MNIQKLHRIFLEHPSVCTDTRKLKKNDLFFALKGDNFDGNDYAINALEQGASYAIVDDQELVHHEKTIFVTNVLTTLQELAKFHRNFHGLKIIALTGSNGKTTTKELVNNVLLKRFTTIATSGNLNNHIGVPLTLLSMDETTEIGVVEMGANHQKEIEFLCEIAQPDYGYITNFGKAHLEGFGGIEGVIIGKSELYDYLIKHKKYIFLNADDETQHSKLKSYIKKFGFSEDKSDYYNITFVEANPFVELKMEQTHIKSNLIGQYNFTNICAACIIGKYFGVSLDDIKSAIEDYTPSNNRSQIIRTEFNKIILDAYNANPTSMKAALDNFSQLHDSNKVAILGDMFELGESASEEHQFIADYVSKMNLCNVFLVGKNFASVSTNLDQFEDFDALKENLLNSKIQNSTILTKGSRGMALERVLDFL